MTSRRPHDTSRPDTHARTVRRLLRIAERGGGSPFCQLSALADALTERLEQLPAGEGRDYAAEVIGRRLAPLLDDGLST